MSSKRNIWWNICCSPHAYVNVYDVKNSFHFSTFNKNNLHDNI